jgi:hypothetical protein
LMICVSADRMPLALGGARHGGAPDLVRPQ